MDKLNVWVFCATAPGHSYATIVAIESLVGDDPLMNYSLCLSVQGELDREALTKRFPDADVFEPKIDIPKRLTDHPRVRSIIHSSILNEGWARRKPSDYSVIIDNDVVFSTKFDLREVIGHMKSEKAVLLGTEYPAVHKLRQLIRRQKRKPRNVPNCIFCVMDSGYYSDEEKVCKFSRYAERADDPCYNSSLEKNLAGCQIDTGAEIYIKPLREQMKYISITCSNRWHPYAVGRLIDKVLGSDVSPEFYRLNGKVVMHHFKKLSIIPSLDKAKIEYQAWLKKVQGL